jgi:hypothetical protein
MANSARVTSIDTLREFRSAVGRFVEEATNALGEVDADVQRTLSALRHEYLGYWQRQVRERHDLVMKARSEIYKKELTSLAESPSVVAERKAMEKAKRRVEEAEQKVEACKRHLRLLDREALLYRGQTQSLQDALGRDLPLAMHRLERMAAALEAYARLSATPNQAAAPTPAGARAMNDYARGVAGTGAPATSTTSPRAALRRRTPAEELRRAVPLEAPLFFASKGPTLPEGGLLARVGTAGEASATSGPGARVVYALGTMGGADCYVERLLDGSWFIGPVGDHAAVTACLACTAPELVSLRPAMREVLELPRGFLAVIAAGGVSAVLNERDEEVLS